MKPWEKYQAQPEQGPWSEYAPEQAVPPVAEPAAAEIPPFIGGLMGEGLSPEQVQAMGGGSAAILEPIATVATGMIAEPVSGLAGIASLPFGLETATKNIAATREALTYQPKTAEGKRGIQAVGETLAPVGKAISYVEEGLGDTAFELTGSPAIAAAAKTLPTATMEALGFGLGRKAAKASTGFAKIPKRMRPAGKVSEKAITKSLLEAAPEVKQIKNASRAIYKEIDNLKVAVKPSTVKSMLQKVVHRARFENVDDVLTPKSARVVKQFTDELDSPVPRSISDLDQLRKKAQIAAKSLDPSDARVGAIMIDEIDDFMDKLTTKSFSGPDVKTVGNISERYKAARSLWGRSRRAELISDAFAKADLQASGFENGLRIQLRQLLNNKKRSRFFTKDELAAMSDVVKGTGTQNTLKLIGRLGFSEGAATNVLASLVGYGVLGPIAPVAGQVSRKLAQVTTKAAANKIDSLIRSGAKGRDIAKAYLQSVPKANRSITDLTDMLLASGSKVDDLLAHSDKLVKEAAEIARARRLFGQLEAAGAAAPVAVTTQDK